MSASSNKVKNTGSKTPIERAATRDLVKDQVKTAKTPICPFPGLGEIEGKRFLESGIRLVECPNCVNTRTLLRIMEPSAFRLTTNGKRIPRIWINDGLWGKQSEVWLEKRESQVIPVSIDMALRCENGHGLGLIDEMKVDTYESN